MLLSRKNHNSSLLHLFFMPNRRQFVIRKMNKRARILQPLKFNVCGGAMKPGWSVCDQSALDAGASDLRAKGGHPDSAEKMEEGCIFVRVRLEHL